MNSSPSSSPLQEPRRFGVEVVELALEDRDHVPGNVLEHLGVLERPGARAVATGAVGLRVSPGGVE